MNTELKVRLGKRIMARGEFTVHPRSFTRPTASFTFRRNDVDIYVSGKRDYSILYNQFQAEVLPFNHDFRHFNFQMGLRWDYMHYRDKLESEQSANITLDNEHYFSYRARLDYNSEDDWNFPTRGARFKAEYAYLTDNFVRLGSTPGLSKISADWRQSITFGKRFTLQPMVYGRFLLGKTIPLIFANTVGGDWFSHYLEQQMPFAGVGNIEYVKDQFVAAQLQGQLRIGSNHYVLLRWTMGQQSEKLKELFKHKTLYGIQGAYYYKTIFGPLGATIGYSNRTKKPYFFLNLGYEF
jgi:NTE family protein